MRDYPSYDRAFLPDELVGWLEKHALLQKGAGDKSSDIETRFAIRGLFVSKIHEEFWALVNGDFQMYEDIGSWAREEFISIVGDVEGAETVIGLAAESLDRSQEFEIEDYFLFCETVEKQLLHTILNKHPVGAVFLLSQNGYFEAKMDAEQDHDRQMLLADDPDNEPRFDEVDFADEWEGKFMNHHVSEWVGHGFIVNF